MAKTRHKFKNHCSVVVAVGDLSVFVAANFAPMSVLRALSLPRSRGGTLAGWLACWLVQSFFYDVYCVPHQVQDRVLQEIFIDHAAGRRVKQTQKDGERERELQLQMFVAV